MINKPTIEETVQGFRDRMTEKMEELIRTHDNVVVNQKVIDAFSSSMRTTLEQEQLQREESARVALYNQCTKDVFLLLTNSTKIPHTDEAFGGFEEINKKILTKMQKENREMYISFVVKG